MKPAMRSSLILVCLAVTVLAAIYAPENEGVIHVNDNHHVSKMLAAKPLVAGTQAAAQSADPLQVSMRLPLAHAPKDLFWMETPETRAEAIKRHEPAPQAVAPPLPFIYMGKMLQQGEMVVFLTQNDVPFIVKAGDLVANTYRVDAIAPPKLEFTYLPLKQKQTMNIGVNQ